MKQARRDFSRPQLTLHDPAPKSTTLDVAAAATRASDMVREKGTLSAAGLAAATGVSLAIAAEQLLEAEKRALVARDDTVGRGLVFYPNLFLSASA